MLTWLASGLISEAWHWLLYWSVGALVIGTSCAAAWFSPLFKEAFIGAAAGAALLMFLQGGAVSFRPADPAICEHPRSDPNGPVCQKWHSTDSDRGYGYWEPCEK